MKANIKELKNKFVINEEMENCLLKSEDDIRNGRTRKAEDVFKELNEKYGLWVN